jgi:hypothetical protein
VISETTWLGVSFFSLAWGTGRRLAFRARVLNDAGREGARRQQQGRVQAATRRFGAVRAGPLLPDACGRGSGLSG